TDRAVARLLNTYLDAADAAGRKLMPNLPRLDRPRPLADRPIGFATAAAALQWLEAERANLVAAVHHTHTHGPPDATWHLADALHAFFRLRRYCGDWLATALAGHVAAQSAGARRAAAAMRYAIADAYWSLGDYRRAAGQFDLAWSDASATGWSELQVAVLQGQGQNRLDSGDQAGAIDCYNRALQLAETSDHRPGLASAIASVGLTYHQVGRLDDAIKAFTRARELARETGTPHGEASSTGNLGFAYWQRGELSQAEEHLLDALRLHGLAGARNGEANVHDTLGRVYADTGQYDEALRHARHSLALARDIGDRRIQVDGFNTLAEVYRRLGHEADALRHYHEALELAVEIGYQYGQAPALLGIAACLLDTGREAEAIHQAQAALAVGRGNYRTFEAQAHTLLARIHLVLGQPTESAHQARLALAIEDETGQHLDRGRTLLVLADATTESGDADAANAYRHEAQAIFEATGAAEARE
ncbi:MAG TPA: tetratricopeptide repeat protein, partial [Pseudonocardiaceae bacterium]